MGQNSTTVDCFFQKEKHLLIYTTHKLCKCSTRAIVRRFALAALGLSPDESHMTDPAFRHAGSFLFHLHSLRQSNLLPVSIAGAVFDSSEDAQEKRDRPQPVNHLTFICDGQTSKLFFCALDCEVRLILHRKRQVCLLSIGSDQPGCSDAIVRAANAVSEPGKRKRRIWFFASDGETKAAENPRQLFTPMEARQHYESQW